MHHLARGPHQLVDRLNHVDRDTDRTGLVGDRARDRLPNPPCRIGREFIATAIFELIHRLHQTDIPLLNEVQELQAAIGVFLRDRDHEAEVGLHHLLLRARGFFLALLHGADNAAEFADRQASVLRHPSDFIAQLCDFVLMLGRKRIPALALQLPHARQPFRIQLMAVIFLQELLALHLAIHGEAHQLALLGHEVLVDGIQTLQELLNPGIMQLHLIHEGDHLFFQFVVFLVGGRVRLLPLIQGGQAFILHLLHFLVGLLDLAKNVVDLRGEFLFHRSEGDGVLIVFTVAITAFAILG